MYSVAEFYKATFASEDEIFRINIFCDVQSDILNSPSNKYLATFRFLYKNNLICIDVKEYVPEHYFIM